MRTECTLPSMRFARLKARDVDLERRGRPAPDLRPPLRSRLPPSRQRDARVRRPARGSLAPAGSNATVQDRAGANSASAIQEGQYCTPIWSMLKAD